MQALRRRPSTRCLEQTGRVRAFADLIRSGIASWQVLVGRPGTTQTLFSLGLRGLQLGTCGLGRWWRQASRGA
jgi:hypothetical protein